MTNLAERPILEFDASWKRSPLRRISARSTSSWLPTSSSMSNCRRARHRVGKLRGSSSLDGARVFRTVTSQLLVEFAEGEFVVFHETWTGYHTGEFFGVPASGRSVTFRVIDIARISGGKVREHWGVADNSA